jgi:hypothetical protein
MPEPQWLLTCVPGLEAAVVHELLTQVPEALVQGPFLPARVEEGVRAQARWRQAQGSLASHWPDLEWPSEPHVAQAAALDALATHGPSSEPFWSACHVLADWLVQEGAIVGCGGCLESLQALV